MIPWPLISKISLILIIAIGVYIYWFIKSSSSDKIKHVFRGNKRNTISAKSGVATSKRSLLLEKIKKSGFAEKEVFVSIDDFFDGNQDDGSIGVNIYPNPPALKEFYNTLKEIQKDPKIQTILVRIADKDDTEWFFSDMVYISGNYTLTEVKKMFKLLRPDEIYEGMMYDDKPSNLPQLNRGSKAYSIWWD